jgi:hypothetical protein
MRSPIFDKAQAEPSGRRKGFFRGLDIGTEGVLAITSKERREGRGANLGTARIS